MTSDIDARIQLAAAERLAARARLSETLATVQHRLDPSVLADNAFAKMRSQSSALAEHAADYVRERKPTFIAIAVAGVMWFFRKDIARIVTWAMTAVHQHASETAHELHETDEGLK
ncbi:DUF3618 domain-containing protein [Aquisediminimonas sediminicola]|uniref:DUF3618 domain-containing protein n=1 Tax=Alteraquisediminimonas sediminicola TaxID=2676787 RepID=UPI001C8E8E33|nr:DUF3618 domain-containing protein [Aquisediminimonas sediminicola]